MCTHVFSKYFSYWLKPKTQHSLQLLTDVWFVIEKGSRIISGSLWFQLFRMTAFWVVPHKYIYIFLFFSVYDVRRVLRRSRFQRPRFPVLAGGNLMIMMLIMRRFYRKHLNWIMSPESAEIDAAALRRQFRWMT